MRRKIVDAVFCLMDAYLLTGKDFNETLDYGIRLVEIAIASRERNAHLADDEGNDILATEAKRQINTLKEILEVLKETPNNAKR